MCYYRLGSAILSHAQDLPFSDSVSNSETKVNGPDDEFFYRILDEQLRTEKKYYKPNYSYYNYNYPPKPAPAYSYYSAPAPPAYRPIYQQPAAVPATPAPMPIAPNPVYPPANPVIMPGATPTYATAPVPAVTAVQPTTSASASQLAAQLAAQPALAGLAQSLAGSAPAAAAAAAPAPAPAPAPALTSSGLSAAASLLASLLPAAANALASSSAVATTAAASAAVSGGKPSKNFPFKCKSVRWLKQREIELEEIIRQGKRSCDLLKKDLDSTEKKLTRDVEFLASKKSNLDLEIQRELLMELDDCGSQRSMFKTLIKLTLIKKLLKMLFKSHLCPPINIITTWLLKKLESKTLDADEIMNRNFENDFFSYAKENEHESSSKSESTEKKKDGSRRPFAPLPPPIPPSMFPPPSLVAPSLYAPPTHAPPISIYPSKFILTPITTTTTTVASTGHNNGGGIFGKKCKSIKFLQAREHQLNELLRSSKRSCFLDDARDTIVKMLPREAIDPELEISLLDPTSRVVLRDEPNDECFRPKILFQTISTIRKLIRYLFFHDDCPPIKYLTTWIMKKLSTRELSQFEEPFDHKMIDQAAGTQLISGPLATRDSSTNDSHTNSVLSEKKTQ